MSRKGWALVLTVAMSLISAWLWVDVLRHDVQWSTSGRRNAGLLVAVAVAWAVATWVRRFRGTK